MHIIGGGILSKPN